MSAPNALAATLALLTATGALADERLRAVDGDNIRIDGVNSRIVGLDTPEIRRARCSREFALGMRAKEIAEGLLAGGGVTVEHTGRFDKYRRPLVVVRVHGSPWLDVMRDAGAAVRPYRGGRRGGWC